PPSPNAGSGSPSSPRTGEPAIADVSSRHRKRKRWSGIGLRMHVLAWVVSASTQAGAGRGRARSAVEAVGEQRVGIGLDGADVAARAAGARKSALVRFEALRR